MKEKKAEECARKGVAMETRSRFFVTQKTTAYKCISEENLFGR